MDLVHDTSSECAFQMYEVSLKYSTMGTLLTKPYYANEPGHITCVHIIQPGGAIENLYRILNHGDITERTLLYIQSNLGYPNVNFQKLMG